LAHALAKAASTTRNRTAQNQWHLQRADAHRAATSYRRKKSIATSPRHLAGVFISRSSHKWVRYARAEDKELHDVSPASAKESTSTAPDGPWRDRERFIKGADEMAR